MMNRISAREVAWIIGSVAAMAFVAIIACSSESAKSREHSRLADDPWQLDEEAYALIKSSDYQNALPRLEMIAMKTREVMGLDSPQYGYALFLLAKCHLQLGHYDSAKALRTVGEKLMRRCPESDGDRAMLLYAYAQGILDPSLFPIAVSSLKEAVSIQERILGTESQELIDSKSSLVLYLVLSHDCQTALPFLKDILQFYYLRLPETDSGFAAAARGLGTCFIVMEDTANSIATESWAFHVLRSKEGTEPGFSARIALDLARTYGKSRDYVTAEKWSDTALTLAEKSAILAQGDLVPFLDSRAAYSMQVGKLEQAELFCRRAMAILESEHGSQDTLTASQMLKCAIICRKLSRQTEAEQMEKQANSIFDHTRPVR